MRQSIIHVIQMDEDLHRFLREQPIWYRRLSRNPDEFSEFKRQAKAYYRKTLPDKVAKISNGMQMATMMLSMFPMMK